MKQFVFGDRSFFLFNKIYFISGEKNFECNICSKSFARKATLTKHLKIHANIRDFECEYCGKTFIQKWSLQSHLKTHVKTKN